MRLMVVTGLEVASPRWPPAAVLKLAYDGIDLFEKTTTDAVEHRTRVQEHDLLLIDEDAQRLSDLRKQGLTPLNSAEALEIRDRLRLRARQDDEWYAFASKALRDPYVVYALAKCGSSRLAKWIAGRGVARFIGARGSTRLASLGEGTIRKQTTRTQWRKLTRIGELGQKLSDDLVKALLEKAAEEVTYRQLGLELDERVEEVLRRSLPPEPASGHRVTPTELRLQAVSEPQLYMPVLLPAIAPIPAAQPVTLHTYQDPVVTTAAVQSQVISSDYDVEPRHRPARPEPSHDRVGGMNLHVDPSRYRNPNWDGSF